MRKLALVSLVVACMIGLAGCAPRGPRFAEPKALAGAGLQYYWSMALPLPRGESIVQAYLIDEDLYCLTNRNTMWTIDAAIGQVKWYASIASPAQTVFRPCHADGMKLPEQTPGVAEINAPPDETLKPFDAVLVNTLSEVQVYDRSNGALKRRIAFPFAANTGGACDGRVFYVGATNGLCHALSLREAVFLWATATSNLLTAPIETYGGRVYIGGQDGVMYAVAGGRQNSIVWRRPVTGPIVAASVVDGRGCFVGSDDNRVYAFDLANGHNLWDPFICEGPIRDGIQASENSLFARAQGDRFYAVNIANGRGRWNHKTGQRVLAVMHGTVYLLTAGHQLDVVDEMLGTVKTTLPLTGMSLFPDNTHAPAVYGITGDGIIKCIRPVGAAALRTEDLKKPSAATAPASATSATSAP
jgi:hypothetical protein